MKCPRLLLPEHAGQRPEPDFRAPHADPWTITLVHRREHRAHQRGRPGRPSARYGPAAAARTPARAAPHHRDWPLPVTADAPTLSALPPVTDRWAGNPPTPRCTSEGAGWHQPAGPGERKGRHRPAHRVSDQVTLTRGAVRGRCGG